MIKTPHDSYFKAALAHRSMAESFFRQNLPEEMVKAINWDTLQAQKNETLDHHLQLRVCDYLYRAQYQNINTYVYFLIEHQSTRDPMIALRSSEYELRTLRHYRSSSSRLSFPLVLSLVYYTGEGQYRHSIALEDYIDDPCGWLQAQYGQRYLINNNNKLPQKKHRYTWVDLMDTVFYSDHPDIIAYVDHVLIYFFHQPLVEEDHYLLSQTIAYYLVRFGREQYNELYRVVQSNTIGESIMMTGAQSFIEEGRQEGRQEVAKRLLEKGFPVEEVEALTHIDHAGLVALAEA